MSSYYSGTSGLGIGRLALATEDAATPDTLANGGGGTWQKLLAIVSSLSMPVLAYHGYQRDGGSVWGAFKWGLFGSMVWPITLPIAFAQGYGKRKVAPNRRRRVRSNRRRTSRRPRRTSRRAR